MRNREKNHQTTTGHLPGNMLVRIGTLGILCTLGLALLVGRASFGIVFLLVISALVGAWGWSIHWAYRRGDSRLLCLSRTVTSIVICMFMISLVIFGMFIARSSAMPAHYEQMEYALILGAGLEDNHPGRILRSRLDRALEAWRENPEITIIVSGGMAPNQHISEACAMAVYLEERGVKPDRIIREDQAKATAESIVKTRGILERIEPTTPLSDLNLGIVTSDFHAFRAVFLAHSHGFSGARPISATTPMSAWLNYALREYFAFIKFALTVYAH